MRDIAFDHGALRGERYLYGNVLLLFPEGGEAVNVVNRMRRV
jgi:hypothetical protein